MSSKNHHYPTKSSDIELKALYKKSITPVIEETELDTSKYKMKMNRMNRMKHKKNGLNSLKKVKDNLNELDRYRTSTIVSNKLSSTLKLNSEIDLRRGLREGLPLSSTLKKETNIQSRKRRGNKKQISTSSKRRIRMKTKVNL